MPYNLKFVINSKIELNYGEDYYKSTIQDVQDDFISISIPIKGGEYIPLRKGDKLEFIYYYQNNIYKFYTYVIDRQINNIPVFLIEFPKEVFKIQRRRFVRIPIICSILYSKLEENNGRLPSVKNLKKSGAFKATIVDLSGGGMKLKLKEDVKSGDIILAYIPIKDEEVAVKAEVIRVERDEISRLNVCGVSFIELEKRLREKIIKFIFQIMREQIKKN